MRRQELGGDEDDADENADGRLYHASMRLVTAPVDVRRITPTLICLHDIVLRRLTVSDSVRL